MSQITLILLVISLWGLFIVQPLMRSMKFAEPVLKLIVAIILGLGVALSGFIKVSLSPVVTGIILMLVIVFIAAPIVLNALMRFKRYAWAQYLNTLVYWSDAGRNAMRGFLARAALQRGDAEAALELLPVNDPLIMRVYSLQQRWDELLLLPGNSPESHAARIEALIAKGNLLEAEYELNLLKQTWEKNQTPEGYRSMLLSETRLAAEKGNIEKVQKNIQSHLVGLPTHLVFALLARVAETSYNHDAAKNLYSQAYLAAPESQQVIYAAKLQAAGQTLPERTPNKTPYGTFAFFITLIGAYLMQVWLENGYGAETPRAISAFLLNFPEVPESMARWRFLSYAFVHGGLAHIAFNAWALLDLGRLYESKRNWANLLAAFVFGAVMGAYFTLMVQGQQQIILVGASGGICGIAGALLADSLRGRSIQDRQLTRSLMQWIVFISLFGLIVPNVSFWGHTGGIIGGLLWGFIRQGLPKNKRIDWFAGGLSLGLMIYTLMSVVNLFFETHP